MEQRTNVVRKRREAVAGGACPVAPSGAYARRTTRTTAPLRAHALAGGKCGWTKAQPLPAGRTGREVPVSQFEL